MGAIKGDNRNRHVISVDEKTGIQALKRIHEDQPMKPGKCRRVEYEYERNGTVCLMAAVDVAKGNIPNYALNETRTEEDFLAFIKETVAEYPQHHEVIFMADHLNTHLSVSLVEWIAKEVKFEKDLGKKGVKGILKNMKTRKQFLENQQHRIRFVYTPKHCSWLNPIENWFAKLQRHVIKHGDFSSVEDVSSKISTYIYFYNDYLAKPLKWKFKGFSKGTPFKYLPTIT